MIRAAALMLTVFTGFSGLVYEVAWQRYLATLLGSHAEATATTLGLFLAGLSLGYALFGRITQRIVKGAPDAARRRLLVLYGLLESSIGLYALLFPLLFNGIQALSFQIARVVGSSTFPIDVVLCALLVLPPTVLMGATIPILTQALSRSIADATRFHAFVYAFNTAGAFAGALAAGFFLIPTLGLQGVMITVSLINLSAGALFVVLGLRGRGEVAVPEPESPSALPGFAAYAAVALLVGFAMMAIQTVLIRLGGLSLGASEYTFSMVVAVFVLCIALGSFAVSALPSIRSSFLLINMWGLVVALYFLYGYLEEGPYWAHVVRSWFRDSPQAFYPFHFTVFMGLLALIGPAVILSGASLPLLFHQLRRETGALGAVAGRLYAWNTVGSLLGALLGGYVLFVWLDLHHVYRIAVAALVVAAAILTVRVTQLGRNVVAVAFLLPILGAVVLLEPWDPRMLTMGLFRERHAVATTYQGAEAMRQARAPRPPIFYDDDPTLTVSVTENPARGKNPRSLSIATNGKADGNSHFDYTTMGLMGLLGALFADGPENSFVIGLGTGITAGELAALPSTRRVRVAEISRGVIEAAPLFDFANHSVSTHPKIEIVRSDAYRALLRTDDRYDVIASEPSNPWVTGVEMLFSREFLEAARGRLAPGGVYVQWYHQYETDAESVALVLRTYASVFDSLAVWFGTGPDLLLLGFADGERALDLDRLERRASRPEFAAGLARAGIESLPALLAHEILPLGVIHAAQPEGPIHTLHHPRLSHHAGRAFFRGWIGRLPFTGWGEPAATGKRNSLLRRYAERYDGPLPETVLTKVAGEACKHRSQQCAVTAAYWRAHHGGSPILDRILEETADSPTRFGLFPLRTVDDIAAFLSAPRSLPRDPIGPDRAKEASQLYTSYYYHAFPFDPEALEDLWERCRGSGPVAQQCKRGRRNTQQILTGRRRLQEGF